MQDRSSRLGRLFVGLLLLFLLLAAATTVSSGPFTGNGTQPDLTHELLSPGNCNTCHGDFDMTSNHEPWPTWAGSMMANSTRDPLFWAALDVANNDVPDIGDFCLRCHAPVAWLEERSEPPGGTTDGCGLIGNLDAPNGDFSGVTCHLCHRMMVNDSPPMGQDNVYYENGQYWLDDEDCTDPGSGPCRRGPYDYLGGETPPPHVWAYSDYHVEADVCGNCHNVTSPAHNLIDDTGDDTGIPFPIERTFKEWQQSDFGPSGNNQTCQDCHMPQADSDPVFACAQQQNDRAGELPVHRFVGGNTWVPRVLRDEYPNLGRTDEYDASIAWATDMLQNQSATVEVTSLAPSGDVLEAQVRVTNLTGHKLPTGYPEGRRMWLQVTARDGDDTVLWQSGAYDESTGILTEDEQAKIYQVKPGIWNENGTNECDTENALDEPIFHFVRNNCIAIDNRIPPAGFTGGTDLETRPVNYTYPETSMDSGVLVHWDDSTYSIPIPVGAVDPITVEATLYFQTTSKEYVEFLWDQAVDNNFPDDCLPRTTGSVNMSRGELLYDLWNTYDRAPPVDMGTASQQIDTAIFDDGFESGSTAAWSVTVN